MFPKTLWRFFLGLARFLLVCWKKPKFMKAYIFHRRNGDELSVRFYKTGGVTIKDKNGEHEVGEWRKGDYRYIGRLFSQKNEREELSQHDLAWGLVNDWDRLQRKEKNF